MSIIDSVKFLKGAISRGPVAGLMGCYFISQGSIYAHNEWMQAGAPFEGTGDDDCNVPSAELEAALGRMTKGTPAIDTQGTDIVIKCGRLKATIQKADGTAPDMAEVDGEWLEVPEGLFQALRAALPFVGDQGWTSAARLLNGRVTAINNRAGIDVAVPDLAVVEPTMISAATIEFLLGADDAPVAYISNSTNIVFQWGDGRWARFQLSSIAFPESVDKILQGAQGETPIEIEDDWRTAYEDVAALADGDIVIHPGGLEGSKGAGRVLVEIPCQGLEKQSRWSAKVLEPMLKVATHWNPNLYPQASPFTDGKAVRGLVMGIKI